MQQAIIDRRVMRVARDVAVAAITLGLLIRTWHPLRRALWLDEAYSRFAAEQDWWFLWHIVPRYETHPPFYYSLLHLWRTAAGDSLLAYRLPGLLCGFATIAITGLAARALATSVSATPPARTMMICFALSYAALCPMLIDMSCQVRPYPVMILVYAVATLLLLRLAADADARRRLSRRDIAGFFVAEALMLWLHTLGPLFGIALTLALLLCVARRGLPRSDWAWLAAGQMAAGLVYLPALVIALGQMPTWVHSTWLVFDPTTLPDQLTALFAGPWRPLGLYAAFAFAGGIVQFVLLNRAYRIGGALLVLAGLPVLLALLLSWKVAPVFLPRTLSPAVIPFTLSMAMLPMSRRSRGVGLTVMALLLSFGTWYDLNYANFLPGEDWYAAADWIAPRVASGDVLWAYPNETALPLDYALMDRRRAIAIRPIPEPVPALGYPGDHPTGNGGVVSLRAAQITRMIEAPSATKPRAIWLAGLAAERIDPQDALLRALLRDHRIGRRYEAGEIRILELVTRPAIPIRPSG